MDYRLLDQTFDHIVSIGMLEHVGYKNYQVYVRKAHRLHKDNDSLFLLQTTGNATTSHKGNAWLDKYIFPNGVLPSVARLGSATEDWLVLEDWHSIGQYCDATLLAR